MKIEHYKLAAFSDSVFEGNPASVCVTSSPLADETKQKLAAELRDPITAFLVVGSPFVEISWFTPEREIPLCGHGTLAASRVLFERIFPSKEQIELSYPDGKLTVSREQGDHFGMVLPAKTLKRTEDDFGLAEAMGVNAIERFSGWCSMLVLEDEEMVRRANPAQDRLQELSESHFDVLLTARGNRVDFVSRFFSSHSAQFEDYVTGSAHCALVPYWTWVLQKRILEARQLSARPGDLLCEDLEGQGVKISGRVSVFGAGELFV